MFADATSGVLAILDEQTAPLSVSQVAIALAVYLVVSVAVTTWLLKRRDLA